MFKRFIFFIISVAFFQTTYAQESWKLSTEKDGVKVFTKSILTSKIKALKIECILNASASQLVAVIMNIEKGQEWVYSTKSCVLLKQVSPSELYYYSEVILPWPAQNRDFVAHITVTQNPANKIITVDAPCVNGYVPEKANIVRIQKSLGKWMITPLSKNQVKIEYTLAVDPAGTIPAWLVNLVASQGPLETFKKLRTQLQKQEYKNVHLSYIID
ncbi:START domain-containing protein [Dyadobacter sp. CY356]|uniref:START domain-containing protein n=1 Tax=Dyadobacter sp. CY356 TaxID=2906442 RepID=UPI001F38CA9C|nr:START domain-containing protein [Dyadobacter sp. CY356]MCF0055435.1 START domain-containing protein [Dyadobacter sp. CY356]